MAKFIEPSAQIITPASNEEGKALLRRIEEFSRISHRSEDRMTEDSWRRFIQFVVLEKGDWSVTEHVIASVVMRLSRGITHELVRHRIASYTQESTRFVNYGKRDGDMEFILPEYFSGEDNTWDEKKQKAKVVFQRSCERAETDYLELISLGVAPQIARDVLGHALASTIAITMNLRTWRHLFMMRTSKETHPDFRRITGPLLAQFQERIPLLYDDIQTGLKQSEAQSKPR